MIMADYKEMYLTLFRAVEQAVNLLVDAQRKCEELYINQPEAPVSLQILDSVGDQLINQNHQPPL